MKADLTNTNRVVLKANVTETSMRPVLAIVGEGGSGTGDVAGPSSSTSGNVATFANGTGKLLADSGKAHSTDGTLASNSDAKIPTEKAVKTYADTKQPLDSDLTAIAALAPTNDDIIQRKAGSWVNRTMAQLKTDLAIVVANISDFASSVASAITAERTAAATLTNKDLTSGTNTFPTFNQNTTGSAATLTTPRTIGTLTGDVTSAGSAFNGSANNSNATTLATVNSNVGSFGSATQVATFTVDGKGRITAAGATSIAIPSSAVTDFAEAVRDTVGATLVEGTGVTITVDDGANTITIAATGGGAGSYTDEEAQDAVGSILTDSSEIDLTYNDATPSITASIVAGSIDESKLDASVNASLDLADSAVQPAALTAHIDDTTAAHNASAVWYDDSAADLLSGTSDVQAALDLVDGALTLLAFRLTNVVSGTTYTVQDSDFGKRIQFTNAASIAVTVPNTLRSDFVCDWEQFGAGVPTFTGSSCTVRARGGATKSAGQYAVGGLSRADSDEFLLYGDITT